MRPATKDAVKLMHDGTLALADVEAHGMRIDVDYLDETAVKVEQRIRDMERHLRGSRVWHAWRQRHEDANLDSRAQLADVLFNGMGHECQHQTKTGRNSASVASLESVDIPFTRDYLKLQKLKKLKSTYLKGVRREVCDGYLHPSFNLHLVKSYRSSADSPNFQNIPIRDPLMGKLIRRAFIPRDDHVLVEIDYSAIEVRIAACYHHDPTMVQYIEDDYDLHSDMAAECFKLDEVPKKCRQVAKGMFVFAAFYGDWYPHIAENLWNAMDGLETKDGVPLRDHLASRSIDYDKLGDEHSGYMSYIKRVYDHFWQRRFPVYDQWRRKWWDRYCERGWFRLKSGFICQGVYRRNEVINYPVQGAAFHCLLWSLVRLNKRLKKMRSVIVGQIHDSMLLDVHRDELDDVLAMARQIMCEDLRKAWDWIVVPLEVEVEMSETNWFEKEAEI